MCVCACVRVCVCVCVCYFCIILTYLFYSIVREKIGRLYCTEHGQMIQSKNFIHDSNAMVDAMVDSRVGIQDGD